MRKYTLPYVILALLWLVLGVALQRSVEQGWIVEWMALGGWFGLIPLLWWFTKVLVRVLK